MEESAGEPQNDIIEATFKINYSRWLSLCAPGRSVAFQIYSNDNVDSRTEKGMASEKVYLKHGKVMDRAKLPLKMRGRKINIPWKIMEFKLKFEVGRGFGIPGAILVENKDKHEFFLESAILHYIKKLDRDRHFYFDCKSWVYPLHQTGVKRVFFSTNKLYLPNETPAGLKQLRKKELEKLRGEKLKSSGDQRKPWDRIYEYDCYNDLGDPDNGREYARPVLGGRPHPYPRRLKTARPRCHDDPESESRPVGGCFEIYVPPDERLSHCKLKELENNLVDALVRFLTPKVETSTNHQDFSIIGSILKLLRGKSSPSPSKSHEDSRPVKDILLELFSDKPFGKEMEASVKEKLKKLVPHDIYNKVISSATKKHLVYSQLPSIIEADCFRSAESDTWLTDEEFVRQLLAGTNPVAIRCLKTVEEFPSQLKQRIFLDMDTDDEDVQLPPGIDMYIKFLLERQNLVMLDHSDFLPFLSMVNGKGVCAYATRTLLSADSQQVDVVGIQVNLPDHSKAERTILPTDGNIQWGLAKAHVAANDSAHHQLVSHWLHTHAVVEPFIIATRRQLSMMHPIHKLLDPHFKDTLHINALARRFFLNAGGILETMLFTGQTSMLFSSESYKKWRFDQQALPSDLIVRGMMKEIPDKVFHMKRKNLTMRWWEMMRKQMQKNMEKGVSTIEEEEDDDDSDIDIDSDYDNDNDNDNNDTEKDQEMIAIYEIEKYLAVKRWKRKMQQILKGVLEGVQKEGDDRNDDDDDDNGGSGGVDDKILIALYEIEKYLAMQGKFVLKNYPYARDGMEIWKAIETWVSAYCNIFYKNNESVENDAEIQAWWSEIREEGHGDQKEGWYPLSNLGNLTMALTTLIWITSGLHAALNFGQYAYVGWPPNRPMLLRKPIPNHKQQREEDNQSPNQQERDDASTWLKPQVLPEKFDMAFVIAVMDVLSRHTSDELYLGQRPPSNEWKEYDQVNKKFEEFKKELVEIEKNIKERNKSYELMNMRLGTAKIPYKILYPDTSKANSYPNVKGGLSREDITGRGIPNSISI